ncbi:MAG: deoxyribodipyrimidine photo-lyase [Gemmatimonadaceae bacterium]|nr:deoxyribodipyrimidine photo-lyase [Gemmatimonadaceae bacterium]
MHRFDSRFVQDQLTLRTEARNAVRLQPEGEYVLYWMQSTQRLVENWALRQATLEADRLGKPLVIYQGLNPHYEYASARTHAMILGNAAELAAQAESLGYTYLFHLRHRLDGDNRVVDRLAARAALVVTDAFPTAGVDARTNRVASRLPCRLLAVESHAIVPAGAFAKEEYAARTIRTKLARLLDLSLEPVADVPPRKRVTAALRRSLEVESLNFAGLDLPAEIARCAIDHSVAAVPGVAPGLTAARARLEAFCQAVLPDYAERRNDPADVEGSSRLSPYLHFGHIAAAEVARTVRERGAPDQVAKFFDELVTWRELSLNFCVRNPQFGTLDGLPNWVRENMARHAGDPREHVYSTDEFERAATHHPLWNAAQRELLATGRMHNVMRMYWGKYIVLWSATYADALSTMVRLNNRYALDGRDPSSHAGIQWCLGKFDRPWQRRPVLGTIRYMSLDLAYRKFDARGYEQRWG